MSEDVIDTRLAAELLQRQAALQARAGDVLADLALVRVLTQAGDVTLVGSYVTGLMSQPDIDVNVVCDTWSAAAARLAVWRRGFGLVDGSAKALLECALTLVGVAPRRRGASRLEADAAFLMFVFVRRLRPGLLWPRLRFCKAETSGESIRCPSGRRSSAAARSATWCWTSRP